jgi:glutathione S-transferase
MKLYYAAGSCALAVHVALEEAGAQYEPVEVRFDEQQQRSPGHLARSPLGRVPVLETSGGALTEVPAILGYIAALHPAASLLPADPFGLARMQAFNAFLSSSVHPAFAHIKRPQRWAHDADCQRVIAAKAVGTYGELFGMIETRWLAGPWVMGGQYTIADPYLYTLTRWLPHAGIEVVRYPLIDAHSSRMARRDAVRRALAAEGLD